MLTNSPAAFSFRLVSLNFLAYLFGHDHKPKLYPNFDISKFFIDICVNLIAVDVNNLNRNLLFLLKEFDATQSDLASHVGVSQNSISNWINEISSPNAPALVKIHQYFGVSIDALLLTNIEKDKILTEDHIREFKRIRKAARKDLGKAPRVSREYFTEESPQNLQVSEPEPVIGWAVMGQLKQLHEKLDRAQVSLDHLAKKRS